MEHQPTFKLGLDKSAFAEASIFAKASAFNFYGATRRRDKPARQDPPSLRLRRDKKCAVLAASCGRVS